jgi:hypothetical protein
MDSAKGMREYVEECNRILKEKNTPIHRTFITFAPYPGRFKWREWRIVKAYHTWKFKKNHPGLNIPLIFYRISPNYVQIAKELLNVQPMAKPDSPIYFLHMKKD